MPATALVYNRSPAVYKHKDKKSGVVTVVKPGESGVVPKEVADNWAAVSQGAVSTSIDQTQRMNNAQQLLAEEKLKTAQLAQTVKDLQARLSKLEDKSRPK